MTVIGISGSYGGLNAGDEAILSCIVDQLNGAFPDADLVVFSRNPRHTTEHHGVDRGIPVREATGDQVVPEVERLDLLLLGGGGILYDEEVHNYLREVELVHERGIPAVAYAIGVGPLREQEDRQAVREALNGMDAVTVRDVETKRAFEEVGVRREVVVTADPAWLLTPVDFSEEMLEKEGVSSGRPLVGVSVRERGGAAPSLEGSAYHGMVAAAADFVVARFEADVVFVPMERRDVTEAHRVMAEMAAPDRAHVLTGRYGPRQLLGLMQHFDLAVGMRLHFLIFAALAGVPLLALPYASKVEGFLEALGLPAPSTLQQQPGPLLAAIDRLWDRRDECRRLLADRVPTLQKRADESVEIVQEVLEFRAREGARAAEPRSGSGS